MILTFKNNTPKIDDSVFLANPCQIIGDVKIGMNTNIWYNVVLRGDVAPIDIGEDTNIQDGTIIHTSRFNGGASIGDRVTIGHLCLLHACKLHNDSFVGMSSTVMDNAEIEPYGFLAANSLLTPGKIIKSGELWAGSPAKFVRKIGDQEKFLIEDTVTHYIALANEHKKSKEI